MRSDAPASITTSASAANLDADDPIDDSDANSDSDSDSDDDTAALMAELQKIKREKVFTNFHCYHANALSEILQTSLSLHIKVLISQACFLVNVQNVNLNINLNIVSLV